MIGNFANQGVKAFGGRTRVPNDNVARLMYYLSCVDTVINYNGIDKLTDYQNYESLTRDDLVELFQLVLIFNPKIFVDAGIFIIDDELLPYDLDNQFYQITDERIGLYINDQIAIGGRTVKVLKVMACNEDWLMRNYFTPWENLFELAEHYHGSDPKKSYHPPQPPVNHTYKPPTGEPKNKNLEKSVKAPIEPYKPRHESDSCCILI